MKTKEKNIDDSVIKAMKKANRELQFERNGGGQWIAVNRPHKNKKKYNRKRDKKNYDLSCHDIYAKQGNASKAKPTSPT